MQNFEPLLDRIFTFKNIGRFLNDTGKADVRATTMNVVNATNLDFSSPKKDTNRWMFFKINEEDYVIANFPTARALTINSADPSAAVLLFDRVGRHPFTLENPRDTSNIAETLLLRLFEARKRLAFFVPSLDGYIMPVDDTSEGAAVFINKEIKEVKDAAVWQFEVVGVADLPDFPGLQMLKSLDHFNK